MSTSANVRNAVKNDIIASLSSELSDITTKIKDYQEQIRQLYVRKSSVAEVLYTLTGEGPL